MKHYIITVEGEIIAKNKQHYAQNWVCSDIGSPISDTTYHYEKSTHTVKGNLILDEDRRAVPYAIYYSKKGICATESGHIIAYPWPGAALEYYKEHVNKIKAMLCAEFPDILLDTFYRGLFIEVFSALELFLSDFILCAIYSEETIYNNSLNYYRLKKSIADETQIEKKMHNFFFNGVVYHAFDVVHKMFDSILKIEFPNTKDIERLLHKRNNIVHRFSFSNLDRMSISKITKDDIVELLNVVDVFINTLYYNYTKIYAKR